MAGPYDGHGVAQQQREFRDELESLGVNATVRMTRGAEIDAACGQLAASSTADRPVPS